MAGSNMLIVYAASSTNVTVSPRLGAGEVEPQVNPNAVLTVLDGTGITSDGSMVANIRCDSCLTWSGGSMNPTDSSSSWIFAHKSGDALEATSTDAQIAQHDGSGSGFTLDLTQAVGGSSSNPFVAAVDPSPSSPASQSASAPTTSATAGNSPASTTQSNSATQPTGGVSNPLTSTTPSSSGSSQTVADPNKQLRTAHAVIMPLVFLLLFPLAALTLYVPYNEKVRHIHAPLQGVSLIFTIAGMGLGISLGKKVGETHGYHQVIGYIVVAWMVLVQPALGLGQHLHFRRNGTRSPMGHGHRWLGRAFMVLGVVNGGLGFMQSGKVGTTYVPDYSVIVYSVIAVLMFLLYVGVVVLMPVFSGRRNSSNLLAGEKSRPRSEGYEMHGRSADQSRRDFD